LRSFATAVISTVEEIAFLARDRLEAVSTQAVYDVLFAVTEAGLVRRIESAGSPMRFESRVGDNHHHVICRACRTVSDVDCARSDTRRVWSRPSPPAGRSTRHNSSTGAFAPPAARSP
jgi:Fe2+ or Zn2+ uptake regulation protein